MLDALEIEELELDEIEDITGADELELLETLDETDVLDSAEELLSVFCWLPQADNKTSSELARVMRAAWVRAFFDGCIGLPSSG